MAKTPRLDPYLRLISRFFEALYLLCLLGEIRGPHVATVFDSSSAAIRRRFLLNLAYLCDSLKGGASTTSIAVQDEPTRYVFWVSSNVGPSKGVLSFLGSVLEKVKMFAKSPRDERARVEEDLTHNCVQFSSMRLRKQARSMINCAQRCINHLLAHASNEKSESPTPSEVYMVTHTNVGAPLVEWLLQFSEASIRGNDLSAICETAYKLRNDPKLKEIERFAQGCSNQQGDISVSFCRVRHIIGRLAAHIRSVKQLTEDCSHVGNLIVEYEVSAVPVPRSVPLPLADGHTNLRGVMTRMCGSGSKDARFQSMLDYLSHVDQQAHLEDRLVALHGPGGKPPRVHAEIQMLHHFYDNGLGFMAGDRYVATSKPSCLCCKLYFRHHPAACVEPDSHERVWPHWGPVLLPLGSSNPGWAEHRKVLGSICQDLVREVKSTIEQRQTVMFAHSGSLAGYAYGMDIESSDSEGRDLDSGSSDQESDPDSEGGVQV